MKHEEAWKRLPDLLEDRDDPGLLAHVRACAECQRQLFLLGRVDRLLRARSPAHLEERTRRPILVRVLVAAAVIAAATIGTLVLVVPRHSGAHEFTLRMGSGKLVGEARMHRSDSGNMTLALTAHDLPTGRTRVFLLWAGDAGSTMQVGRFMVNRSGGCRVRFNLPETHSWHRFWVTRPGSTTLVAST